MRLDKRTAILILGTGEPTSPEDARALLESLYDDPLATPHRWFSRGSRNRAAREAPRLWSRFEAIAQERPLARSHGAQARSVAEALGCEGYVTMRWGQPDSTTISRLMLEEGMERVVAIPGLPHPSDAVVTSACRALRAAWAQAGGIEANLAIADPWHEHEGYLAAAEAGIASVIAMAPRDEVRLVFAAPALGTVDRGGYHGAIERTATRLGASLDGIPWSLAWQPSFVSAEGPGPSTADAVREAAGAGARSVIVAPLGYVADAVDTVHGIDMEVAAVARESRTVFYRVPALNDDPSLVAALCDVVQRTAAREGEG